jgi:hypothetical protein
MKTKHHSIIEWDFSLWFALQGSLRGAAAVTLHLREFAKNSRIFAALAPGANRAPQFFFPRKSGSQNSTGIRCADTPLTKETKL